MPRCRSSLNRCSHVTMTSSMGLERAAEAAYDQFGYDTGRILDVVLQTIEAVGCEKVQLRDVAERGHISLATIYKYFPSRDELIVAAVKRWLEENVYRPLAEPVHGESLYDRLMWGFRHVFEPWERQPAMLDAFVRASAAAGDRFFEEGMAAVEPVSRMVFEGVDQDLVEDITVILMNVTLGAMGRFAAGRIHETEILRIVERTVYRLTAEFDRSRRRGRRRK